MANGERLFSFSKKSKKTSGVLTFFPENLLVINVFFFCEPHSQFSRGRNISYVVHYKKAVTKRLVCIWIISLYLSTNTHNGAMVQL